jgi:hypothetical protein
MNGFINHLYTPLGTTSTYSAITDLHNLQITIAPATPLSGLLCIHQPFPAMASNSSFTRTGSIFKTSRAELNSQLTTDN